MRTRFMAAAVSIFALAMPATAMAAGGGGPGARPGASGGADHGAGNHTVTVLLAPGSGYDQSGGSSQVRALQRRLAAGGFAPGPIDGLYGPRTEAATSRFQSVTGLGVDGIAGPYTLAALSRPTPVLYPGAGYGAERSRPVRHLQRLLIRAGYGPGQVDGLYGPHTALAVRRFQAAHRLRVDGIAYPRVFTELRDQIQARHRTRLAVQHPNSPTNHPTTARPTVASPGPAETHGPSLVDGKRQSSGSPSTLLAVLLAAALTTTLVLVGARYTRRRRTTRPVAPETVPESTNGQIPETITPVGDDGLDPDTAFRFGAMLEEQTDLAGAEVAYRQADLQGHAGAASNLGVLLERRGDREGAGAAYRRAAERGDPNGAFNLAMLQEEQGDLTGAETAYRRADLQGHAAAASNLGVLLERRGDLAGAEAAYRRADQRGDPNGAFNLAVLLEEQSDLTGAEAAYQRADERGPAEVANAAREALMSLRASLTGPRAADGGGVHAG